MGDPYIIFVKKYHGNIKIGLRFENRIGGFWPGGFWLGGFLPGDFDRGDFDQGISIYHR